MARVVMTPLLAVLLAIVCTSVVALGVDPQVKVQQGVLQGFVNGSTDVWLGIPYAAAPVGSLRFRPPIPPPSWSGVRPALQYSDVCVQTLPAGIIEGYTFWPNVTASEDCLTLNVWRPTGSSPGDGLNVVVWIHGGSLLHGSGTEMRLVGKTMSEREKVIVVTINYRLGVQGFLALPELLSEDGTTGNYGVQDQRMALTWVRDNIANFGGDPSKVTIAGESAGGSSVCFQLLDQRSAGLFHNAIAESTACYGEIGNLTSKYEESAKVLSALNCTSGDVVACVRAVPWQKFLDAQNIPGYSARACVDQYEFTDMPWISLAAGSFNHVPLLAGNVLNEGTDWVYGPEPEPIPSSGYAAAIKEILGFGDPSRVSPVLLQDLLKQYPCAPSTDCRVQLSWIVGDFLLLCPTMLLAEAFSEHGLPTFSYIFSHRPSFSQAPLAMGVTHASEIPFVFSNVDIYDPPGTQAEVELAHNMTHYWVEFAKTSKPSEQWPTFDASSQWTRKDLNVTGSNLVSFRYEFCQFWAQEYPSILSRPVRHDSRSRIHGA